MYIYIVRFLCKHIREINWCRDKVSVNNIQIVVIWALTPCGLVWEYRSEGHTWHASNFDKTKKKEEKKVRARARVYVCLCVMPTASASVWKKETPWKTSTERIIFNPLNPELNPIYLLALLAHHFLHVSSITVKSLTLRLLMSYIYGAHILDVSISHTTTQHTR